MYEEKNSILPNGKEAIFGLYRKSNNPKSEREYVLLGEFSDMEDVLNSTCIDCIAFRDIITDDETELLGQD